MLKQLIQLREEVTLTPDITKKVKKAEKSILSYMKSYMGHREKLVTKVEGPNKVRFTVDFNRWYHPEDIDYMNEEFEDALKVRKDEDNIHSIEQGNGHGSKFVEALLSGLQPGMDPVQVDAFFPTVEWVVTYKTMYKAGR